jgi:hypothetical protein
VRPLISIVLPTDTWERINPVLSHLERLSLPSSVEIVVVIPADEALRLDRSNTTVVSVESVYPLSSARAAGVRAATGDYVFMGETHSFPREGMFDAILAAHERSAIIVVPALENENPGGLVSWACFLTGYASWTGWRKRGVLSSAPLFNVSYRKSFLLASGEDLDRHLLIREDIRKSVENAKGMIFFEPSARVGHVNIARVGDWLAQRIVAGRTIGSVRSSSWRTSRRLLFAAASPLIPVVLLQKHWRGITETIRHHRISPAVIAVIAVGMYFQAWGEMLGYLVGESPDSVRRYDQYEMRQLDLQ